MAPRVMAGQLAIELPAVGQLGEGAVVARALCQACGADKGEPCRDPDGKVRTRSHRARRRVAELKPL